MHYLQEIIGHIEEHSVAGIRECFSNGISQNDHFRNEPLIYELTSEYARGPRFKECVQIFVDYGLEFKDNTFCLYCLMMHVLRSFSSGNQFTVSDFSF